MQEPNCVGILPSYPGIEIEIIPGELVVALEVSEDYYPVLDSIGTAVRKGIIHTGIVELDSLNIKNRLLSFKTELFHFEITETNLIRYKRDLKISTLLVIFVFPKETDLLELAKLYCQFPYIKFVEPNFIIPFSLIKNSSWGIIKRREYTP